MNLGFQTAGSLNSWHNAQMLPPGGRLFVPKAQYQADGSSEVDVQLNAGNDGVNLKWTQACDMALSSWSVYVSAVATQGDISTTLYDITTGSAVQNTDYGTAGTQTTDSGDTDDVWIRETFTAVQLYAGHRYELRFNGTDGDDFSLSGRRWNETQGSMFPDTCSSETTTDNWSTPADLAQNSKPALLNVILNSVEAAAGSPVPALWFGRDKGKWIFIPGTGLMAIPEAGVSLDCSALTAGTVYYVYIYNSSGTLTLEASTTVFVRSDGLCVKSGATTRLLVGKIVPQEIISGDGYQGPVDVMDRRLVAYPGRKVSFGKLCPYYSATQQTVNAGTGWVELGTSATDLKIEAVFLADDFASLATQITGSGQFAMGFMVDGEDPGDDVPTIGDNPTGYKNGVVQYNEKPGAGLHSFTPAFRNMHDTNAAYPELWIDEYGSNQYRYGRAAVTGIIRG